MNRTILIASKLTFLCQNDFRELPSYMAATFVQIHMNLIFIVNLLACNVFDIYCLIIDFYIFSIYSIYLISRVPL